MKKLLLLALATPLAAQAPAVRLIAAPDAVSRPQFGIVPAVRALPGGRVLVNDVQKRQLTLLDPSLANATIIADSAAGQANSYGVAPGGLIAYVADSTFFVDPAGLSMFVIDPNGKVVRVGSVPRSQDARSIASNTVGIPGLDSQGRLIYRAGFAINRIQAGGANGGRGAAPAKGVPFAFPEPPDSAALIRLDLGTRKVDTAAYFKIPKTKMTITQSDRGVSMTSQINPLPIVDDWAVLADGSVAIVRGQDYHVDFMSADGAIRPSGKIAYDWQRLSDDDKVAVIDSAKKAAEAARASGGATPGADGGAPRMVMQIGGGGGDGGGGLAQRIMAGGGMPAGNAMPIDFVSPADLPDYRPVFSAGAARGDADGNLWVRTTAARAGSAGYIYDVINTRGELIDRVQIPAGRQIVGFAKGGVVYMSARDANATWIERTHR
jgi:hypothetical protein